MNKLLLSAVAVLLTASMCFAQTKPMMHRTSGIAGKVKAVVMDGNKNPSEIVVVDATGKESAFAVSNKTQVFDKDSKPSVLGKLASGENVDVKFVTVPTGAHAALAIKING